MKKITPLFSLLLCTSFLYGQLNVDSISNLRYSQFVNDIWGYESPDGVEYALVGLASGVSIVSLEIPENPTQVAFVQGSPSTWRDIKTLGDRAYVTTEAADGLMVIDLSGLPTAVSHSFWNPTIEGSLDTFRACHNLYIDEKGYCYLSGSNLNNGGFIIADIFTNPDTPVVVGVGPPIYSHDIYVRDDIAYSSDVETGQLTIHNVADKSNIQLMGMLETPFRFTHNAWLSDDGKTIFTTDEVPDASTAAYDISDLEDIRELNQFIPAADVGQGVIPHNVHYHNGFLVISHYGNGLIIVDANRPDNLVEVGNFDTSPLGVGGFVGAWGAYPFLASGLVLVSDSENGLFVTRPNYTQASYLEGTVTDASTGEGLFGATISFGDIVSTSGLSGEIKTGIPETGEFDVTISKRGYLPQVITIGLSNGSVTSVDVSLEVAPTFTISGMTITDENGQPIEDVIITLIDGSFTEQTNSNSEGGFTFEKALAANYTILAGRWGYILTVIENVTIDGDESALMIELKEGIEDPFALDLGWTVTNENIFIGGGFELGTPVFSPQIPFISNDIEGDIGSTCYTTAILGSIPDNLFIAGRTALTSPTFDLSTMMTPTVSYSTIYGNVIFTQQDILNGVDTFKVFLDNGMESVLIDQITNDADVTVFGLPEWRESIINVKDFLAPTATMTITFELDSEDFESVAEAGVDFFRAYDAGIVSTKEYIRENLSFQANPNPFSTELSIAYEEQQWEELPTVVLYDALGKVIYQSEMPRSQMVNLPSSLQSGVYFLQLRTMEKGSKVLKLVK